MMERNLMSSGISQAVSDLPDPVAGRTSVQACLSSEDGRVSVHLVRSASGLFVRREAIQRSGERLVQCAVFKETVQFHTWCDNDPLRFNYPRVSHEVRRYGSEALLGIS